MKRRKHLAVRYCLIAWVSLLRWILFATIMVLFVSLMVSKNTTIMIVSASLIVLLILCALVFFIEYPGVRCLMCGASLLRKLGCVAHGNAKQLCGSHTLRATVKLATYPTLMDCPYCDGHFRLAVRKNDEGKIRKRRRASSVARKAKELPEGSSTHRKIRR